MLLPLDPLTIDFGDDLTSTPESNHNSKSFFSASGIDFGYFLNAHLKSKILSPNYLTSTIAKFLTQFAAIHIPT